MANIFLVEDIERLRRQAKTFLEQREHQVVLEAGTLKNALTAVKQLAALSVNIAVLDANLELGHEDGNDGQQIAEAIRRECPEIKILTWSQANYGWGDAHCPKGTDPGYFQALVEEIDKLLSTQQEGEPVAEPAKRPAHEVILSRLDLAITKLAEIGNQKRLDEGELSIYTGMVSALLGVLQEMIIPSQSRAAVITELTRILEQCPNEQLVTELTGDFNTTTQAILESDESEGE